MGIFKRAAELAIVVNIVALAACSSGGGGPGAMASNTGGGNSNTGNNNTGSSNTDTGNTGTGSNNTSGSTDTGNTGASNGNTGSSNTDVGNTGTGGNNSGSGDAGSTQTVSIGTPPAAYVGGIVQNGSAAPSTTSIPFLIAGDAAKITPTSAVSTKATISGYVQRSAPGSPASITLTIPELGVNTVLLKGDGTPVLLGDGNTLNAAISYTDYMTMGAWSYSAANGQQGYVGMIVTGHVADPSVVPTTGTATYSGTAAAGRGVIGAYAVPSGTGTIQGGALKGDVSLQIDFASGTLNGAFTGMTALPADGGAATPWNDISLTGKLQRSDRQVGVSGGVTTAGAPAGAGAAGLSSAAQGSFAAVFFGPTAQELGGGWRISETAGGGKAAFGTFGAAK
jgi:hypothetical protein